MPSIKKNYPPKARKKLVKRKVHGIEVSDHYDWIRDSNWQKVLNSPNVLKKNIRKYIDEENKWTQPTNPPPPLFLGEKERDLVKQVNDELIERVIGQTVAYYAIDLDRTNYHPLYK